MTSSVISKAHCATNKELVMVRSDGQTHVLQDGETHEMVVYDDLTVTTYERLKAVAEVKAQDEIGGDGPHK